MAGSTLSTDSLSSPSPTPTPSPPLGVTPLLPMPSPRPANNIDEDSELSELTEDDQDGSATADKRAASAAAHSSSKEIPAGSEDDDDDRHSSAPTSPRQGRRPTTMYNARRGGAPRRKGSSIVPAPMWGWAESKGPPSATPHKDKQEEEEEEEQSDPPRPMEEEEPEEEEVEEDDGDGEESGGDADGGRRRRITARSYVGKTRRGGRRQAAANKRSQRLVANDEDGEEPVPVLNGDDDDGSAYGDSYPSTKKKRVAKPKKKSGTKPRPKSNGIPNSDEESPNQNTESEEDAPQPPTPPSPSKGQGPSIASNSAASALTALAAIADAVDPTSPTPLTAAAVSAIPSLHPTATPAPTITEPTPCKSPSPPPKTRRNLTGWKRRLPAPLDLKIDTMPDKPVIVDEDDMDVDEAEEEAVDPSIDNGDVDMDGEEEDNEEEVDEDEEGEEEVEEADENSVHDEEEAAQADVDADEEVPDIESEVDEDVAEPEGDEEQDQDQDQEQDQEQDPDAIEAGVEGEQEQEHEEGEDEEPSPDGELDDHEIELQPAHRAEALEVLAHIELKFALLREMIYVERMEALAWEEQLVQNAAHPEMIHLQKELSKRRDKRLELASRKRSYEVANATKRRKADEDAVWSWWKFSTEELQTDMISETNRKRRKLERDRRAVERPQPIRRIPLLHYADLQVTSLPPPSLRKVIKSTPFGTRKQNKPDTHHHHHQHLHSQYPKTLVYPEISTLSSTDIANDLDFLYQNRRVPSGYEIHQPPHFPQQHFAPAPQRNGSGLGFGMGSGFGMGRLSNSLAINGGGLPPPPSTQPMMGGPPTGSMLGYDQYPDGYGPPSASGRMRDPPMGAYAPGPGGPPLGPSGSVRETTNTYSNFAGPGGRVQQPSHMAIYPSEHEISTIGPPPGMNNTGGGHQLMPHHPYFSQASVGPGGPASNPYPPSSSSSASAMKGMAVNGRRSISPGHILPIGSSSTNPKNSGTWLGPGMGMGNFHLPGSGGKGGDRDMRMTHEEEERERAARERERIRKRDERDLRERENRDRERDPDRRPRDRTFQDLVERGRDQHLVPQQPSASGPSHTHSNSGPPPTHGPGGADPHHHHSTHHRPHGPHHHHILHRHHQGQQHASSSLPPPNTSGPGGPPPIIHSPRSTRDYEASRPASMHSGPGQPHPTEVIMLSSGGKAPQPSAGPRDRDTAAHWPSKGAEDAHHPPIDYRDRDREARDRDPRKMYTGQRPPSRPPMIPLEPVEDRGDRPMAMPFVMASSHAMQQTDARVTSSSSHLNGSSVGSSTSSPRGAPPSWNTPAGEEPSYRMPSAPSAGYLDAHVRSPVQGHRYAASGGSHIASLGRVPNSSSSSSLHRTGSPPLASNRVRPPQSPSYPAHLQNPHRSPVTSPKMRPLSPVPNTKATIHSGGPGPGYSSSPRVSGPGRTATPTGHHPASSFTALSSSGGPPSDVVVKNGSGSAPPYPVSSRTASPLMSSLHVPPSTGSRSMNGGSAAGGRSSSTHDRERHLVDPSSPRLAASSMPLPPPSKLSTVQVVDGH